MEEYIHRREQLISLDRARRIDVNPSPKDPKLSRLERDADFIFREIRALEATSIWGPESDPPASVDDPALIFPGMAFLTGEPIHHCHLELCLNASSSRYYTQIRAV